MAVLPYNQKEFGWGTMKKRRKLVEGLHVALYAVIFAVTILTHTVVAVSNSISQGYQTSDKKIVAGMAVSLISDDQNNRQVEATNKNNVQNFVGIVTTIDDNLVSLTNDSTDVLVTTTGEVSVFVVDINGKVAKGDLVTISPLNGAFMKSNDQSPNSKFVMGTALEAFNDAQAKSQKVTDAQNGERIVKVDKVKVEINQSIDTRSAAEEAATSLQLAGESITGRPVGQAQVFAAILVLLIVLIVEGSIIYGAVHSTITALGRNPLAKRLVFKQILQVSWLALVVLLFGLGAIYLVLWI